MAFSGPLEDRIAIRELLETYANAACRVDAEAWGSTWAEDGLREMPDYPLHGHDHGSGKHRCVLEGGDEGLPGRGVRRHAGLHRRRR